jgi:hypothetical protein
MEPVDLPEVEHGASRSGWGPAAEAMRAAGAPVPQIFQLFNFRHDAITACARFHFYNRWIDGTGVRPRDDYPESAARLSAFGDAPPPGSAG